MSHTVLVVDDEPFVRVTLASLKPWRDEGYDFRFEAGNGAQALELIREHPEIDLVLLDLAMPVLDGIGFLEALPASLQDRPAPTVLVLSAHDDFPLVRRAFTLGARDYMLKSEVDGDSLLAMFRKTEQAPTLDQGQPRLEAREKEFLADRWLRDALTGDATDWSPVAGVDSWLTFPCTVWAVAINDFETVAHRHGPDDLGRFGELFLRTAQQVADRRGGGRAVMMSPDVVAVVGGPGLVAELVADELKASLERYLSVKVSVAASAAQPDVQALAGAWKDLGARRPSTSRIVLQTRRYLRANFATPGISLEQLAERVGVSRNHLSYEFAKETGQTITDYIARLRVEAACHFLATTTLKVYEIAERVGYSNVEHFSRVFRKVAGTSPARWASEESANVSRDLRQ
jgi:YesN/AraC family two-component response regulator